MPFPRRLLTEGEEIVIETRPHWIALVGPILVTILVTVGVILALANLPGKSDERGHRILFWVTIGAGILIILVYPVRAIIRWATSHFVVTNERLIHRVGLIAKDSMEIPLERINDVRFHQGVLERLIGAGDLRIESAGELGQNTFGDVRDPERIQKTIYETAELQRGPTHVEAPVASTASSADELARLAELRDRGVLTEEEFQTQKTRLLGQG
jgi:uncharacterized membrane protein YdbT with pleckstrin-like domain